MTNEPFYTPNLRRVSRVPVAGATVWQLQRDHHVARCEIRNDVSAGAGADVQLYEDGELLLTRRSASLEGAQYVSEAFRQDYVRAGWK